VERLLSSKVTIGEAVRVAERVLSASSGSARLDAELLMAHALGGSRTDVIVRLRDSCSQEVRSRFEGMIERRKAGEPFAYIVGEREFWGLRFEVSPAVLVPRPESELLVEEALAVCAPLATPRIVDLGTGSGCLIISLVSELLKRPGVVPVAVAVEISAEALAVAERNAERHGVRKFITFVQSDWFGRSEVFSPPYDLVLANPPYIDPHERVPVELSFEPQGALFAQDGGLREVRTICSQTATKVVPGGVLLCEVGAGKRVMLSREVGLFQSTWDVSLLGDGSSADRFTIVKIVFPGK
jgi:release factor glutamine methyltransferase